MRPCEYNRRTRPRPVRPLLCGSFVRRVDLQLHQTRTILPAGQKGENPPGDAKYARSRVCCSVTSRFKHKYRTWAISPRLLNPALLRNRIDSRGDCRFGLIARGHPQAETSAPLTSESAKNVMPPTGGQRAAEQATTPSGSQVCSQSAIGIGAEYNIQSIHTGPHIRKCKAIALSPGWWYLWFL
jgi:hypothetical protein